MRFSFGVNVYAFITMVLFLWLKIVINCQNRYTWEWVEFFCLGFKNLSQGTAKDATLIPEFPSMVQLVVKNTPGCIWYEFCQYLI